MKKPTAAVALAALTLGVGLAGASTAVAAANDTVELMPGTSAVNVALITDDAVFAASNEPGRGNELFARTLESTETGTTLGASTRIGYASGTPLAEHDGTLAYVEETGGRLVLRTADGATTKPAWGADPNFAMYGPTSMSAGWLTSGEMLFSRTTGTSYDLTELEAVTTAGAPVEAPADVQHLWVSNAAVSDDRVVWSVSGQAGSPSYTGYQAVYTAALGSSGPVEPAVRLDGWVSSLGSGGSAPHLYAAGLVDGTTPVWVRSSLAPGITTEVVWQAAPFTETPSTVEVGEGLHAVPADLDGTTLALNVETLVDGTWGWGTRWVDVDDAGTVVRSMEAPGYVLAVGGPYVASGVADRNDAVLVDSRGLPITADETLPPAVVRFDDVGLAHPFFADIDWLATSWIASGYDDGTFRATAPVSRQAMAAFLHRAAGQPYVEDFSTLPKFPDVPAESQFEYAITWLVGEEITGGYADGTFRPTAPVSRQAMAAFLYRFAGSPAVEVTGAPFPDVPAGSEFAAAVTWLEGTGITGGYDDGTFRPTAPVSRQAMAAFLHRFVDQGLLPGTVR